MSKKSPDYIIAIGASAGGVEEILSFFNNSALSGSCYVIIQHLSPDFKNRMVELLSKHSKLTVKEAENGMSFESNCVYLIPSNKYMIAEGNKLYLTDKMKTKRPHYTINAFFNSLAVSNGKKAIGIILSGLGTDGTEGVKAIKQAGGITIVRNPETTSFNGMPANAVASGAIDFILEPEAIPAIIEEYTSNGLQSLYNKTDERDIMAIVNLIKERSPLDFSEYKLSSILRRTRRRMACNNFTNLESYYEFIKTDPEEADVLAKDFLISVTAFFRDEIAFSFLQKKILPVIIAKLKPGDELKLWVAGCATGEEAYSLAILISELLNDNLENIAIKIFATDIDNTALAHASKGLYNHDINKNVSAARLGNYFLKEDNNYRVKPAIRKMVIFAQHDLVKNPPYCNVHLISCRNLMIYMASSLQKKIYTMLLFGLKVDGYLFLGSSENPTPVIKNLDVISKEWKIYRILKNKPDVIFDNFLLPEILDNANKNYFISPQDTRKNTVATLAESVNNVLVKELDSLIVCMDEDNTVIKTYGDTTKYLLQKNFNFNLAELLAKPLAVALNTLKTAALKTNKTAARQGVKINHGGVTIKVQLSVTPFAVKPGNQRLLMVMFNQSSVVNHLNENGTTYDDSIYYNEYLLHLEEELKEHKDKLRLAGEQLDAYRDNMQSFNEELISANEELQSTNEELQSVNEELDTINSNYQLKNKELSEINNDLNNYFKSNLNGQLFINNELLLMKFSPGAVKQINLLDSDIGRPISNISTNIKFETLIDDIQQVLDEGITVTKEIENNNGSYYQVMTMPYTQGNTRNGAIISFTDITELKQMQAELNKRNKKLIQVNADLGNFIYTASHDLLAPLNNIEGSIGVINLINVTNPELTKFLNILDLSIKKFRSVIVDITAITMADVDTVEQELIDINKLVEDVEWSLGSDIEANNVLIAKDFRVSEIMFQKKNLRSIIYNLVSNSVKFKRDETPVIHIKTEQLDGDFILSVRDNGIGIPLDSQEKIFDMRNRLDNSVGGSGIGLYLVKNLVDAVNGSIKVKSVVNQGSEFVILLPLIS